MSKKKKRWAQDGGLALPALQERAIARTAALGHSLGSWQAAKKKKYGIGAMNTICRMCGLGVIVIPRLWWEKGEVPGMIGDALLHACCGRNNHAISSEDH